jgi:ZIP family zinc transporter
MGFSGGIMILLSFVELLPEGSELAGFLPAYLAFFGAIALMFLVDALVPHDFVGEHHGTVEATGEDQLLKTGLFVALGIAIHNFPDGMASFAGALEDTSLGIAIAVAIAIHNIPEGLAVAVPVYAATGSRARAFLWSFLSGMTEPLGAALAAVILLPFLSEPVLGIVFAAVAGTLVFIALDELVPVSRSFGHEHLSIVGVIVGMAVMAASLWLLH